MMAGRGHNCYANIVSSDPAINIRNGAKAPMDCVARHKVTDEKLRL